MWYVAEGIRLGQELDRIQAVFDGWYYESFSETNRYATLDAQSILSNLNEYLKWRTILYVLLQLKSKLSQCNILDAGCGNGNSLRKVIEYGAEPDGCHGLDISSKVIEYAKSHSPSALQYAVGPIDQTDYPPEYFDLILNFGVLIHVLDDEYIKSISQEFARVIKKDGVLLCIVSDKNGKWGPQMEHITRNFDLKNHELEKLLPEFNCVGVYQLYNDSYPGYGTEDQIVVDVENGKLDTVFKLCVFVPRSN